MTITRSGGLSGPENYVNATVCKALEGAGDTVPDVPRSCRSLREIVPR